MERTNARDRVERTSLTPLERWSEPTPVGTPGWLRPADA